MEKRIWTYYWRFNFIEVYMNDSETPIDVLTLTNNPRTSL